MYIAGDDTIVMRIAGDDTIVMRIAGDDAADNLRNICVMCNTKNHLQYLFLYTLKEYSDKIFTRPQINFSI